VGPRKGARERDEETRREENTETCGSWVYETAFPLELPSYPTGPSPLGKARPQAPSSNSDAASRSSKLGQQVNANGLNPPRSVVVSPALQQLQSPVNINVFASPGYAQEDQDHARTRRKNTRQRKLGRRRDKRDSISDSGSNSDSSLSEGQRGRHSIRRGDTLSNCSSRTSKQFSQSILAPNLSTAEEQDLVEKASLIQKLSRGYLARKKVAIMMDIDIVAHEIVDELIKGYISGEFLPDILIDVFTSNTDYDPVSLEEQIVYEEYEKLMNKVVHSELSHVVRFVVRDIMAEFLELQHHRNHMDPIQKTTQSLVHQHLHTIIKEVVHESVSEMVTEYLFLQHFEVALGILIVPPISLVVKDALNEVEAENNYEALLSNVLQEVVGDVAHESLNESRAANLAVMKSQEFAEVERLMSLVLRQTLMDRLMQTMGTRAESALFREQSEFLLGSQIARALFRRAKGTCNTQSHLADSEPLRYGFQMLVCDAVLGSVRDELLGALDAFESELDNKERGQRMCKKN